MKFSVLVIATFIFTEAASQVVQVRNILQSAHQDIIYKSQKEKLDYLTYNPYEVPLFDRVEFRTETHDFELGKQEYAIRVSPNSFKERKYNKKYYQSSLRLNQIRKLEALNEALADRYEYIVNLIKNGKVISIKQQLKLLLEDRINVLTQTQNTINFDYEDLLDAEDDYHDVKLDIIDLERKTERLKFEISEFLGLEDDFELDTAGMVDVNFIEAYINTLDLKSDSSNLQIAKGMENVTLAEFDFKEERADQNNPLGFFQTSYENDQNDPFKNDIRLGFGIRLPIANSSQPRLNRLHLRQLDKESDLEIIKDDVSKNKDQSIEELRVLLLKYNTTKQTIEEGNSETSLRRYLSIEGISPLILLKIQESIIKKETTLSNLEKKIFDEYVRLLRDSGKLVEQPLKNYFSKLFEPIGQ